MLEEAPLRPAGFTLLNLLSALAISAILTTVAIPSFFHLYNSVRANTTISQVVTLLNYSRYTALTHKKMTTVCPTSDNTNCGKGWENGILVFLDLNEDGKRTEDEAILTTNSKLESGASLSWRAFRNKPYIQFTQEGTTNSQNGRFSYCPPNQEKVYWRQIIVHRTGRVRRARPAELKDYC